MATHEQLLQALAAVIDPNTGKDFVSTKQLKNLQAEGGEVSFEVELGYPAKSQIPVLGYTIPYAIGNVLLTIWGAVIVAVLA